MNKIIIMPRHPEQILCYCRLCGTPAHTGDCITKSTTKHELIDGWLDAHTHQFEDVFPAEKGEEDEGLTGYQPKPIEVEENGVVRSFMPLNGDIYEEYGGEG